MKKLLCIGIVVAMVFGGTTAAFAATTTNAGSTTITGEASTIIPDMSFTGTVTKLSLENAYKKMLADSSGAKIAELNKQNADNIAKGYAETIQNLNAAQSSSSLAISYDASNKEMAKVAKAYATTQGPKNYQAEINKLKSDTLKNYYTVKEYETRVQIATDNLAIKETLLSNTQLKYKLGTVSKNDVLKAEVAVNEAKDTLTITTNALNSLKMGFNQFMGYDLMQNVSLTDTVSEISLSSITLQNAITSALKNRNEIAEAVYKLEMAKLNAETYKAYPKTSSKYMNAQMNILLAETANKNAPLTVEADVRTKYMAMNEKYSNVQTGKISVENSKETARLVQLQYDSGLATLTDVQEAQLGYYNAQVSYSNALLEYNLAVDDYELSSGVGVTAASFQ